MDWIITMAFQYYDKEGALIRRADGGWALDLFAPSRNAWREYPKIWPDVIYDVVELTEAEALEMQTELVEEWSTP